jgi:beta-alanine--pyruvate transaminase
MHATADRRNDLDAYWMPFTANRRFKSQPRLFVEASGMYYRTADNRSVLDGTAGLWCVNAGHGRQEIAIAVQRQLATLDYAPSFEVGHPIAFELAAQLSASLPGFDHVFFTNSGSEAVDTALKIALAYHRARGDSGRVRLIGRERAYHGSGFGGMSVGGIASNRKMFGAMLNGVDHIRHTHCLKENAFSQGEPEWGAHLADDLDRIVGLHDASTIAAVIVEPIAGSTGVLVPPKGYLRRLREICDKHGIVLIFDEVITGFGRLGTPFAVDYFGVIPDIIALAKGLTNGVIPMGAVCVQRNIYDAYCDLPINSIELFHGYTYSGHPVAAAAALASLQVYRDDKLFERAASLTSYWASCAHALRGSPHVVDIRNIGLIAAIELEAIPGRAGARAFEVFRRCFDLGLLIRVTNDVIALSPPLIIETAEIDRVFQTLSDVLNDVD